MSKLEKLIQQYCPDGVTFYHLNDVATIKRGERVTKAQLTPDGQYPVISGGVKPVGYLNRYNRETNTITIAQYGTAGYVDWQQNQFWANDVCYSVFPSKIINNRFLYFVLLHNQQLLYSLKTNAIPACLPLDKLASIEIPVPPLPVQEEIVRVLDAFTELQAELQAELQKRKQQYNFYRDNLLNFKDINRGGQEIKWMKLGKICSVLRGKRLTKSQLSSYGRYKVFHGGIEPIGHYDECNREANTTMVINVGASAGTVGFSRDAFWSSDGCFCLSQNQLFSGRYLYYYLQTKEPYLMSRVRKAGIPTLDGKVLEELIIPIPPINEQNRIVAILDHFDALTNDLTSGLPAEMEKRRQQYEYYRDKLLTFKRKGA